MRYPPLLAWLLLVAPAGHAGDRVAGNKIVRPYESELGFVARNVVDHAVLAALKERGIQPANRCSDEVFCRRVFLDVIGTLPRPAEVIAFLDDRGQDKRAKLIDALLAREEFAVYSALKWCDLLRVKAEFPINLWPNAVQAYHRWIENAISTNVPYDRLAREMLTASGSNFRVPAVNFWRAVQGKQPAALAQAVGLTFLGTRIERWPEARRRHLEAFFQQVSFKRTKEWKEEIVLRNPAPAGIVATAFPDGTAVRIARDTDPRKAFADWLIDRNNPWFTATVVNRIWAWLLGRGIVHHPDDFRPDNPPANPELLRVLCRELVLSGYDLRHVYRLILNSSTYQQSSLPQSRAPRAEALFAHYVVRRLDAEVLIDAICSITGSTEKYSSAVPEPFTFVPEDNRSIALSDGSIISPFLEMFGRPTRDTGLWSERSSRFTGAQRLHLLNSTNIATRIERSWKLRAILQGARRKPRQAIRTIYLLVLSRRPTNAEIEAVEKHRRSAKLNPNQAMIDLVWALFNSKEFLYAH